MQRLAIVIPAYKARYFDAALASLAMQTVNHFNVYVGDDASPDNLKSICHKYREHLNIQYIRFENNIGSKNLVEQWRRCVWMSSEDWIWLFSDDDIADKTCVENFIKQIDRDKGSIDIYRFNTEVIDDVGKVIGVTPRGPEFESSEEMAYNLLLGKRGNSMPDHIFSRKVFEKCGGFVYTDYAQGADWATSILFSEEKGIKIIPGAKLYWRFGGYNISSLAAAKRNEMIEGHLQFIRWVIKHFDYLKEKSGPISYEMMLFAARENLKNIVVNHYKGLTSTSFVSAFQIMRKELRLSNKAIFEDIFIIQINTNKLFRILYKVFKPLKRLLHARF